MMKEINWKRETENEYKISYLGGGIFSGIYYCGGINIFPKYVNRNGRRD